MDALLRDTRPALGGTAVRYLLTGAAAAGLGTLGLRWLERVAPAVETPFWHFLVLASLVKLAGDLAYFLLSPRHREHVHIEDYLANDFFTFYRFALPLAIVQALLMARAYVPPGYQGAWSGPAGALLLYLINRGLIEEAQDRRRAQRGGVPLVGQRADR